MVALATKYQNNTFHEIYKKIEGKLKKVMQCMPEDFSLTFPLYLRTNRICIAELVLTLKLCRHHCKMRQEEIQSQCL